MEAPEISDARIEISGGKLVEHGNGFVERGDIGYDAASSEAGFVEDLDDYWEDINARLTISRMVTNSVMKSIVNAISEDAADKIAAKEAEVSLLTDKLRFNVPNEYSSGSAVLCNGKAREEIGVLDLGNRLNGIQEHLGTANTLLEKQLEIRDKNWALKMDQLRNLRQELDTISKSLESPEIGRLQSHDGIEEWTHRKVLGNHTSPVVSHLNEDGFGEYKKVEGDSSDVMESAQLNHMTKEELINYFQSERTKLKRSHESIVQEITEEYFRLKRAYLKEKDSFYMKKAKLDVLKKKIPKIILQVDDILVESEHLSVSSHDYEKIQNDRVNALSMENHTLRDLLQSKEGEVNSLVSQVSDVTNKMSYHSIVEANLLKEVKKLKRDLEEKEIEGFVQEQVCKIFLKELFSEVKSNMDLLYIEALNMHGTLEVVYREAMGGCVSKVNMMMLKYKEVLEKNEYLENLLLQNKKALDLEIHEKDRVKQELLLLSSSMKEKEEIAFEAGSSLIKQKKHLDQALQELESLKKQLREQKNVIATSKNESDTMKSKLQDTTKQIGWYNAEMYKVNEKLKQAESTLQEVERQKAQFYNIIQEKESSLSLAEANQYEQSKQINSIILDVQKMFQVMMSFEQWMTENVGQKNARLDILIHHFKPVVHWVNELKKKGLLYKQRLERRNSDLEKAEEEVDLLADEVDTLLSLLEKIYIALDHYSPVLQHYMGIMEILKLIRRELTRESLKSV